VLLNIYNLLFIILWPIINGYLLIRKAKGKEDKARFFERLGYPTVNRPIHKKLIWLHAASVGESLSILPLICFLKDKHADIGFLITSGTVTSAKILKSKLPEGVIHQFVPVDELHSVRRFLRFWRPTLVLWTESDLWPNLINETAKTCKMILLNARMSEKSYKRWKCFPWLVESILKNFSLVLPQSREAEYFFTSLGAAKLEYLGNLKYVADPLAIDHENLATLKEAVNNRIIFVAASTHKGEEEILGKIHIKLKKKYPSLLTIIIPRHISRRNEIKECIEHHNISLSLRSENQQLTNKTDIYLADTIGELGMFYSLADIVFIGKSLTNPGGGHNPLEPSRFGKAIISGINVSNFKEVYSELKESNAAFIVSDEEELEEKILLLLNNSEIRNNLGEKALKLVNSKTQILPEIDKRISEYLHAA
jgi:3-deoxy-D-manno-octulosonic-acid transferase